jgi:hypothetical protein
LASAHGFRVYVVQAFKNRIKDQDPEDVSSNSSARDEILSLLESLQADGTHHIEPRLSRDDAPKKPTRTVTVGEPHLVRDDLWHVVVSLGELGTHSRATRAKKKSKDLKKWSAEAEYIITFLFPKSGNEFLVIAQTIRRRDPVLELFSLLTQRSGERKKAARAAEDAARAVSINEGNTPPKRVAGTRLLFRRRQAVDNSYIDEIIGSAKSATAVFQSIVPSDRGGRRSKVRRSLQIRLRDENEKEIGQTVSKNWFRRSKDGASPTMSEGVSELAGLLEAQDLFDSDETARYNSASVAVKSESGASTTIAVDTLRDVFTYPVSDGAPTPLFYYEKIAPRVRVVAAEERVDVGAISPMEVVECLDASISVRS